MNFKLRPWAMSDAENLPQYANNFKIARFMMDRFPHPYTVDDAKALVAFATQDDPIHLFAIDINGQGVGGIGIHPQQDVYRKNAELGYWLAEPFWGNGIITEAINEMTALTFNTYDISRIFARPFGTNKASQRVLEKAGFTLEGKFEKTIFKNGEYEDELIYALRRKI